MSAPASPPSGSVTISVLLVSMHADDATIAGMRTLQADLARARGGVEVVLVQPDGDASDEVWVARRRHPALGAHPGRGAAVWAGLHDSSGDAIVVADLDRHGLPAPLDVLAVADSLDGEVQLALGVGSSSAADDHAERLVRPALALHHPHLADLASVRPSLWAVRRDQLEMLPVPVGEGAELAALLDTDNLYGRDAMAEVALAEVGLSGPAARYDEGPPAERLSTGVQLLTVLERRLPQRLPFSDEPRSVPGCARPVRVDECPPAAALPDYLPGLRARRG